MPSSPTSGFIETLKRIDRKGLTARDALLLWYTVEHPGMCGQDIAYAVGLNGRSKVASSFPRLIRKGLIEDRRVRESQAVPSIYHATPAGIQFWRELAMQVGG